MMKKGLPLLIGLGLGMAYLLDPEDGPERRSQIGNQVKDALKKTNDTIGSTIGSVKRTVLHRTLGDPEEVQSYRKKAEFLFRGGDEPNRWSVTDRTVAGLAGAWLTFYGFTRGDLFGKALGASGLGLLARGVTNTPITQFLRSKTGRRALGIASQFARTA